MTTFPLKATVCQIMTVRNSIVSSHPYLVMALGIKVLLILVVACSFGLGMVVLPAHPQTASAYNCIVISHECLETRDPIDLMLKMGMMPAIPGYS